MKDNKGITLTSLIIYILVLLIVVTIVANITTFFYSNVINAKENSQNIATITKFNLYFTKDVKKMGNRVETIGENENYIKFTSGNTYTFQNNAIYFNNVKICDNVTNAQFQLKSINDKKVVSVLISVGENFGVTKTTNFVMSKM